MSDAALQKLEQRILASGRTFFLKVGSSSMAPLLAPNDEVEIKCAKKKELQIGDIVVFERNSLKIAHRIIKIRKNDRRLLYVTKGDAGYILDPPVTVQDIIGKVVSVRREGREFDLKKFPQPIFHFLYFKYRLLLYFIRNFVLKSQRIYLFKRFYYFIYIAAIWVIRIIFLLFCRPCKILIKFNRDILFFVPAVSDLDLLVIVVHEKNVTTSQQYKKAARLCQFVGTAIPLVLHSKITTSLEFENLISWGGMKALDFYSRIPNNDKLHNKLSSLCLQFSALEESIYLLSVIHNEIMDGASLEDPVLLNDVLSLKIFKPLLKILHYQKIYFQHTQPLSLDFLFDLRSPLDYVKNDIKDPILSGLVDTLNCYFKNPKNAKNQYFKPKDALSSITNLLNYSSTKMLASFKDVFPKSFQHVQSCHAQEDLGIADAFYHTPEDTKKGRGVVEKYVTTLFPERINYYVVEDSASREEIDAVYSDLRKNGKSKHSIVLKETSFRAMLLFVKFRPSWICGNVKEKSLELLQQFYNYHFMQLMQYYFTLEKLPPEFILQYLVPNLLMVFLATRNNIALCHQEDILAEFKKRHETTYGNLIDNFRGLATAHTGNGTVAQKNAYLRLIINIRSIFDELNLLIKEGG